MDSLCFQGLSDAAYIEAIAFDDAAQVVVQLELEVSECVGIQA